MTPWHKMIHKIFSLHYDLTGRNFLNCNLILLYFTRSNETLHYSGVKKYVSNEKRQNINISCNFRKSSRIHYGKCLEMMRYVFSFDLHFFPFVQNFIAFDDTYTAIYLCVSVSLSLSLCVCVCACVCLSVPVTSIIQKQIIVESPNF